MPFTNKPKYELGQTLNIMTLKMVLPVRITKRRFAGDVDSGEVVFSYDFVHISKTIENPMTWERVSEESLDDMAYHASVQVTKNISSYFERMSKS